MADNTQVAGGTGDTIRDKDRSGVKTQIVGLDLNIGGAESLMAGSMPVQGAAITGASQAISAGGTGTAGPVTVSAAGNVTFTVKNTAAGSAWAGAPVLVFEQSDDGTSWAPFLVVRNDTGQPGSTFTLGPGVANAEIMFDGACEGIASVRCRVTTGPTTNGLTVVVTPGGFLSPQGNTMLAAPVDGYKATIIGMPQNTFAPHLTGTPPWVALQNPSGSGKVWRVIRCRLELTIATAALLQFGVGRATALSTGGTTTGSSISSSTDSADPTEVSSVLLGYTAAPSTATGSTQLAFRRLWVGLATAAGAPYVAEFFFGAGKPVKAVVLRPAQQFFVFWINNPATAVTANYEIEWTEEPV